MELQLVGQYKEGADLMLAYLDLVRFLSLKHQELAIIVKPHTSEDPEIWQGLLAGTDRVRVDTGTPTSQLIRQSVAAITSGSATAFETELSETPLISFQPMGMPHRNSGFADSLGKQAKSVEEVHTALAKILSAGYGKCLSSSPKPATLRLSEKVYFDDNQLASERMVNLWERALKRDSRLPAGGSIFSMPSEDLRYFMASAFPFLIPLFVRKRTVRMPIGAWKCRQLPHLNRKLVRARVQQMRLILGLEDSVSYRFKGRRGLVIEPSSSFSIKGNSGV